LAQLLRPHRQVDYENNSDRLKRKMPRGVSAPSKDFRFATVGPFDGLAPHEAVRRDRPAAAFRKVNRREDLLIDHQESDD
jgi:hypothetical protein